MTSRGSGALAVITATGRGSTGCDDASRRSNVVAIMMEYLETGRLEGEGEREGKGGWSHRPLVGF